MTKKKLRASEIDVIIGENIYLFREERGLTLGQLAQGMEITSQQLSKYEKGIDRISSSRLITVSKILKVPLITFFGGAEYYEGELDDGQENFGLNLLRNFIKIPYKEQKQAILHLVMTMTPAGKKITLY